MAPNKKQSLSILAIRFSAIGDVAMTVPVMDSFLRQYPQHKLTFVSDPRFAPLFSGMPQNFVFLGADVKKAYHGNDGIRRLVGELSQQHFDIVLDLHGVIRTAMIRTGLMFHGCRVYHITKDRLQRNAVTRKRWKRRRPLASAFDRYVRVFGKAGFKFELKFSTIFEAQPSGILQTVGEKGGRWIGIAPFAAHQGKIYPLQLMEKVVEGLQADTLIQRVFVFAYGREQEMIKDWAQRFPKMTVIHGQYDMGQELQLMHYLDVMLSMDSSNMHLASLVGTRVVSVWGATHPVAGFLGFGQKEEDCVQLDMECRPCSIYGKRKCRFGTCPCMTGIAPELILKAIDRI